MIARLARAMVLRGEPRAGWPVALLLLAAAACPALAARDATLRLPAALFLWAGISGALVGMRLARPMGRWWRALYGPVLLGLAAALLLAAGGALPPAGLLWQDAVAATAMAAGLLRGQFPAAPLDLLAPRFLEATLPRLWRDLATAHGAGEAGASLLVAVGGLASTLTGACILGWAASAGRRLLGWGLPLLVASGFTTVFGGGPGVGLVVGLVLLLVLAIVAGTIQREQRWDRGAVAYSEELRWGMLGWGVGLSVVVAMLAYAIPTSLPLFLVPQIAPVVELPSGLAVIEGQVQRAGSPPRVNPGRSQLPGLTLGNSLEEGPPGAIVLRIRVGGQLAPATAPRYWRSRVLTLYDGRRWTQQAVRSSFGPPLPPRSAPPGAVVQAIEDLRARPGTLVALPEVLGLDRVAVAERLPDGELAALTADPAPRRYTAISLPPEARPVSRPPETIPYTGDALSVPPSVPPRVAELAAVIAGDARSDYERALALERYLRGLPYSYEVRPLPRQGDAVDQFLFEMRHGYCTYYASAMAIMARSLDIPARLAVGYATGRYDAASDAYLVREAEAHAWPELLIEGRWLAFEPTPARPLPARGENPPGPAVVAPVPEAIPVETRRERDWLLVGLIAIALAIALLLWVWRRHHASGSTPLARGQLRLEQIGTRAGLPWPQGATLHEYGRLLGARGERARRASDEAVALIAAARYGRRPLTAERAHRLQRALDELGAALRR